MINNAPPILLFRLAFLVLLVLFFNAGEARAQKIKCDTQNVKLKEFKQDSLYTFNNQYVRAGGLPNITNSKYPLELRMYIVGAFGNVAITTIIGDGHVLKVTKQNIFLAGARRRTKDDVIAKGQMEAHIKPLVNCISYQCRLIDTLAKNGFFVMTSSKNDEFKWNDKPRMTDAGAIVTFEIKVGDKVRNFDYTWSPYMDDQIALRRQQMQAVFNVFENIVKQ